MNIDKFVKRSKKLGYHKNHAYDAYGMLFIWRVDDDGSKRFLGVRSKWYINLLTFLWWGPRDPETGKLLPPGKWSF